jgi:hypothetical protein
VGETAAFYPSEGNPYEVGVLRHYPSEVKLRTETANAATDKRGMLDIYVRIDRDTIDRWNAITQERDEVLKGGKIGQTTRYKYLSEKDPARDTAFTGAVPGDIVKVPFINLSSARKQAREKKFIGAYSFNNGLLDYMVSQGALASHGDYPLSEVSKIAFMSVNNSRISIVSLIKVISAVCSFKKAQDYAQSNSMPIDRQQEAWWGNTFSMSPTVDTSTNADMMMLYPDANYASAYNCFYVPKISSPDDLNKILDTFGDYLNAVIKYWEGFNVFDYNAAHFGQDIQQMIKLHQDFPDIKWRGWATNGFSPPGWI